MGDQELLEILQLIVVEGNEMIDEVEPQLIALQQEEDAAGSVDMDTLNAVFRLFHSIKGSASSLELNNIASVTHKAETLLDMIRSGKTKLSGHFTDLFLKAIDLLRLYLERVDQQQNDEGYEEERDAIVGRLIEAIESVSSGTAGTGRVTPAAPAAVPSAGSGAAETAPVEEDLPAMKISQEMMDRFIQEANELLDETEGHLLELERNPDCQRETTAEVFRLMHSFKGNCGLVGLDDPGRLSHGAESALQSIKEGKIPVTSETIVVLLKVIDMLRESIADVCRGGMGRIKEHEEFGKILERIAAGESTADLQLPGNLFNRDDGISSAPYAGTMAKEIVPTPGKKAVGNPGSASADSGSNSGIQAESDSDPSCADAKSQESSKPQPCASSARSAIRVDLDKLDVLINLVGELVIAQAMVVSNPDVRGLHLENFDKAAHHLGRIIGDLQDIAMSVRMIPLSGTFRKMIRVTHDLARKAGKKVQLNFVGEETEVDKTVIEHIGDPLVHMVRNSIDHGLESPEGRAAAGKDATGTLTLEARHEGGEVWILISDDGRGLDREKILEKAREKGLVKDDGAEMSDDEVFRIIFEPGFSTAKQVTDISGRGVGMDVVRKNIEKIKGRVSVRSEKGKGTTVIMHIPLTLAIIDGMLIRVGNSKFTVPTLAIRESFRAEPGIVTVLPDGHEVVKIRDELLPVLRLHSEFGMTPEFTGLHEGILIVVKSHEHCLCLFADEILGQQETVIKALSDYVGKIRGVSGCTILGNGEVSLILDVGGLIDKAQGNGKDKRKINDRRQ